MTTRDIKRRSLAKMYKPESLSDWFLVTFFPEHLFDACMAGFEAGELPELPPEASDELNLALCCRS